MAGSDSFKTLRFTRILYETNRLRPKHELHNCLIGVLSHAVVICRAILGTNKKSAEFKTNRLSVIFYSQSEMYSEPYIK